MRNRDLSDVRKYRRLTDEQAKLVALLIDEWPKDRPFTWSEIVKVASARLGVRWTRQTLEKRECIKLSYLRLSSERRGTGRQDGAVPKRNRTTEVERRITNLKDENARLRERLNEYDRRLIRYVANALARGVSEAQLNEPLRPILEPHARRRKLKIVP
ncbi:TPA: hypothetical protein QDC22_004081 [Burkholderia stabilis]|nr:hypothetical protein [Burkholderia stabilis]HDR9650218.1 hypothetical protein [Burkholderia stabilis]HDR9681621.1 hypothetical protein [Burkholderia stabilis]